MECPICQAGAYGRTVSRDIILGRKSPHEAALRFKMTIEEVMVHVNDHEIIIDEDTGNCESPDFYMNKLLKLLKTFEDWLNYEIMSGGIDKQKVDLGIKLGREIRLTLESLAQFQGRLERGGSANIQIQQINMKYLQLTQVIASEVCDRCRPKLMAVLDSMSEPKEICET